MRFVISWSFPTGDIYWAFRSQPDAPIPDRPTPTWRNYYANAMGRTRWPAPRDALERWDKLAGDTIAFRDGLFGSTLPAEIKDAASATLALLRTATVIRLEGGEIWAWEGQHTQDGSCEGTCTHVWNYQQALPHLFPALERTLRETEFTYNQLPTGGLTFRQKLPLGSGFDVIGPCADGHFGAIIKTYRDWKLSGDTEWLKRYWPKVKRADRICLEQGQPGPLGPGARPACCPAASTRPSTWSCSNPNSWLGSIYVAALLAASEMAAALGEQEFADKCGKHGRNGAAYIDDKLFNGRWFVQKIDLSDKSVLAPFDTGRKAGVLADGFMETYWSDEYRRAEIPDGRGLHHRPDPRPVARRGRRPRRLPRRRPRSRTALKAVHANNFRAEPRATTSTPAATTPIEDEGGLLVATYPEGVRQPMVAAPYAEEVWTGIEYMSASHMIMRGLVDEGLDVVRAARDRHDGARRNPWNDIECGSYYARSMSAWQLVNALSGLQRRSRRGPHRLRAEGRGRLPAVLVGRQRLRQLLAARRRADASTCSAAASTSPPRSPSPASACHRLGKRRRSSRASDCSCSLTPRNPTVAPDGRASSSRIVRKSFQALEVIHGIDLAVDDGSFTVFVGPSGCGKSTLLRMIAGLEEVSSRRGPHRRRALRSSAARRRAAWRWCSSPTRSTRT